jgi:hypothetical protein
MRRELLASAPANPDSLNCIDAVRELCRFGLRLLRLAGPQRRSSRKQITGHRRSCDPGRKYAPAAVVVPKEKD